MASKTSKAKPERYLRNVISLFSFLLIFWGLYRFLFQLPEEVEELVVKPIFWLVPLAYFLKKEARGLSSLGFNTKGLFKSIYFALGLGAAFAVIGMFVNYLKYGGFDFSANIGTSPILVSLGISFATALVEETTFRGYVFTRLWEAFGNELWANLVSSFLWMVIHLPVTLFVWKLNFAASITYLLLTTMFGIGASFIFAKTRNIFSPIFLHVLWAWPIILFR